MVYLICKHLEHLQKLAFVGDEVTYSGIIGLCQRKNDLKSLSIRNPCLLTKHSMKLIASQLSNLSELRLYWLGKMLINNPWNFEYCLDRELQRIDNLFENGALKKLANLDLSAFYQTTDDKSLQSLAYHHLSQNSLCQERLQKVYLKHCYRLTDAGIQWLIGSCYSVKLQELELSNTDTTGNCFLRKLPNLTHLSLDCCASLKGSGLQNIAASCPNLTYFSISMNKQLNDDDLSMAFRYGLKKLKYFYANYVNINGSCLQLCQSYNLRKLSLHSCSKVSARAFGSALSPYQN